MAISYVTSAAAQSTNGATSLTYSLTVASVNEILCVGVIDYGSYVTGITYGGVAMTQAASVGIYGGGATSRIYILANPATGANNIVVTKSSGNNAIWSVAGSYAGAAQTGQPDATGSTTLSGSTTTTSVTSVADNCWMVLVGWCDNGGTVSAGTGSTKRVQTTGYGGNGLFDSNAAITPAGSKSMTYTSGNGGQTGLAITLAPASAPTSQISSINGVALADISSFNGVAKASIASVMGVANS